MRAMSDPFRSVCPYCRRLITVKKDGTFLVHRFRKNWPVCYGSDEPADKKAFVE